MHDSKVLANVYKRNQWVLETQTKGLTHADSLIQPEARGNCMNYVLGHVLAHRDIVLKMLEIEPVMDAAQFARYDHGSEPVLADGPDVVPLEDLLSLLKRSGELLVEAIEPLTAEQLEREVKLGERSASLGQRIEFFGWHEAYHAGQTEYLRQLAGTDDEVI